MVAGLLAELGCWTGQTKAGDSYNPKGYFENTTLRRMQKKQYGAGLLGAFPTAHKGWDAEVRSEIVRQGYSGGPWLFKTGAHYAGVWDDFDPVVVKVLRDRDRIIRSYQRYGGIWSSYGPETAVQIIDRGLSRLWSLPGIEVDTDALVAGDTSSVQRVCKTVFLPYRKTDFITPGAFHVG